MQKGDFVRIIEQPDWTEAWQKAIPLGTILRLRSVDLEYEEVQAEPLIPELGSLWPNATRMDGPYISMSIGDFEVL